MDRTKTLLRDLLNDSFSEIVTNAEDLYNESREYVSRISKGQEKIVKFHKGKNDVFFQYGIDRQIKRSFGQTVNMAGGSYLIIEHTEALHVIDVNSGSRPTSSDDREEAILKVNLDAAKEVARQLRLRDMGGIIVIDFIDMRKAANRKEVYNKMREYMNPDRAKHTILTISRFGIMQITRQRVRPEVNITTSEKCPTCNGTGKIQASILVTDEIEAGVRFILKEQNQSNLTIHAHPFVAAYLTKGFRSIQRKWWFKYLKRVKVIADESFHSGEYKFFNGSGEQIKITL
jgi:ribonuclease G